MGAGHPRVCGERRTVLYWHTIGYGSSPRVRGTQIDPKKRGVPNRVIPACAGNAIVEHPHGTTESGHPRVCGERSLLRNPVQYCTGSSPRVRGTPVRGPGDGRAGRVIPACAGNAASITSDTRKLSGHPRVCGERLDDRAMFGIGRGSSPRVRGTRLLPRAAKRRDRVIPACAGNARRYAFLTARRTGHPRVCGERISPMHILQRPAGSSPRVRGTHDRQRQGRGPIRVIPACAGNAQHGQFAVALPAGHPRVCGERQTRCVRAVFSVGSSPRVRGTLYAHVAGLGNGRVIPACAGNALPTGRTILPGSGHPRVCGERSLRPAACPRPHGSSPRVRGTHIVTCRGPKGGRVIPACAGNASLMMLALILSAGHPRVCGERPISDTGSAGLRGSSPRVRGTHRCRADATENHRVIPACAGNATIDRLPLPSSAGHPRVCGERIEGGLQKARKNGSSPRVRGTRAHSPGSLLQ